ncbi:NUDIX hydrolase [Streptomyces actinomycinicus]|uniref:NUDIX hydrolase n=1 Tax=Streptomyces actinomycinicus TaxID=1695166 RepID=A0A937JJV7_9ACTN|nr:NUDIX hydrolase [Streptomyces actinomycinicus]MBL1080665.1 NUDIX hydrolase [Streptomyces actinomycinicus]
MRRNLRVAAYAVCVRDGQILLARSPAPDGTPEWVLPGGGMEHGENPYDTVRREVTEETGYRIEVTGLLGVDSRRHLFRGRGPRRRTDHHALRLIYTGEIIGGELRHEVGGSTDFAAWQDLSVLSDLNRVRLVDVALRLWRERPANGHLAAEDRPLPREMNGE